MPPVTIDGPLIPGLIPIFSHPNDSTFHCSIQFQKFTKHIWKRSERERERERERWVTGEVADGDGDAGDGDEAEVVEGVEVSDDSGERRVPI